LVLPWKKTMLVSWKMKNSTVLLRKSSVFLTYAMTAGSGKLSSARHPGVLNMAAHRLALPVECAEFLESAAEQGRPDVQLIIGKEFLVGGVNVDRDLLQAQHWLQRAVGQQHTSAWADDVFLETEVEAKSLGSISIVHSVPREEIPMAFSRQVWRKRVRKGAPWFMSLP
jgi:hypothetical protein